MASDRQISAGQAPAADDPETTRLQGQAADPTASVWVSANAGTGKTHVLTQRVLRILLSGTPPERILCLTYTKAAAAEMSKRVFGTLAGWIGLDDAALKAVLTKLLGTPPSTEELARARTLFTRGIETPGGFKVQTIHAFCERLLQRFPLEAGVPPGFSILDDHTARTLTREAIDATLFEATGNRESPLGRALTTAIRYAADDQFDKVLTATIRERALLDGLLRRPEERYDPFDFASDALRNGLGVRRFAQPGGIRSEMATVLDAAIMKRLQDALSGGAKTDQKNAGLLAQARLAEGSDRIAIYTNLFLTREGGLRAKLVTNAIATAHPELIDRLNAAQHRFKQLTEELTGLDVAEASLALYRLADAVLNRYRAAKAGRAALDFEDLIVKTANLLSGPNGAAWVLYKLDGGLDHILVDEAQDTAPDQWRVVESIANEFFGDAGAGSRAGSRTIFAVGDEKQSIYSFQGARPELFQKTGEQFRAAAASIGMTWHRTELKKSFRTVAPVLEAVDRVFADPVITPGLSANTAAKIHHAVSRIGHGGLVEIWPPELPEPKPDQDAWAPLDEAPRSSPVARLAARIASTIRRWLDEGEVLTSEGRPVRAGDILILVRKREPFASAIVAALKDRKVPVAGADRMVLTNLIAVQDLLALGDFLTLPEDDLSLAAILKSPLFGFDDDGLLDIAHDRKGTLWKALLNAAPTNPACEAAATTLKRWRKEADFLPPYEFYASVLDHDGGRHKMLERLGPEAADGIDEFLNLALTYDDKAPPSLTGFLIWLREETREIKRDMEQGRDEVRVLTVHGSKGLEAPIVILPDTCSTRSANKTDGLLRLAEAARPSGMPEIAVWPVKGSKNHPAISAAKAAIRTEESKERNRLLYVALTRPRDRLYIAGFQGKKSLERGCWYELITQGLAGHLTEVELPGGGSVRRLMAGQTVPPKEHKSLHSGGATAAPRPDWTGAAAPRETQPAIPLAPSRIAPYDFDEEGEPKPLAPTPAVPSAAATPPATPSAAPSAPAAPRTPGIGHDNRFLRGTLTHALLEHLPSLPPEGRERAATGFLEKRAAVFPAAVRAAIVRETMKILTDPVFAPLFSPSSQPEVPIVAELAQPGRKGPPLKLNGQIDRLVETTDAVLIVDYKTNRPPPRTLDAVPEAYIIQLAAYKLALEQIFSGKPVRAALLWTETPDLMEIPAEMLNQASSRIWEFGTRRVDGPGLPA